MTNIEKMIERMGWQPIDSAPLDGTRILIDNSAWSRKDSPEIAAWNIDTETWYNEDGMSYPSDAIECWRHIPTGKEGEIVRVLVDALQTIQLYSIPEPLKPIPANIANDLIVIDATIKKALAKAEELAG